MTVLINQPYLESRILLLYYSFRKKTDREVFNKAKISKTMLGKKR